MLRCCSPIPGEPIVGVVTRSKGVSVHRIDCKTLDNVPPERMMEIHCSGMTIQQKLTALQYVLKLLKKWAYLKILLPAVSDNNTNINYANVKIKK